MTVYLKDLGRHPILSREEELRIATEYQRTRDPRLEQRLVTANLRLVVKLAAEYRRQHTSFADLVQEGNLGLLEAVRRFEPARGFRLPSYAGWWIRAYIRKFLMDNARLVRTGRSREARAQFWTGQLPPSEVSLADAFSEDAPASLSIDADPHDGRPDLLVERRQAATLVEKHLPAFRGGLNARESLVFCKRVLANEPAPLRELGEHLEMTGERVRQIEKSLVDRLRDLVGVQAAA